MNDITLGIAIGMGIIYLAIPTVKAIGRNLMNRKTSATELDYIDLYA